MRTLKAALFAFALPFVLASSLGCSNQGEGEPCSRNNGNEDCESGLVCTSKERLRSNSDLCCPPEPKLPSVAACTPGAGGGTTPDASTGTPDAGGSPDASEPTDAGSDAEEGEDAEPGDDAATEGDAETDAETDDADAD